MAQRRRRTFTEKSRQYAVKMLDLAGATMAEVSRNLGLHLNLLRNWKK